MTPTGHYSIPTVSGQEVSLNQDDMVAFWNVIAQHQDELPQGLRSKLDQENAFEGIGSPTS